MDLLPIVAGLSAALAWGSADYLAAKCARAAGPFKTTLYMTLFSTCTMVPFLAFPSHGSDAGLKTILLSVVPSLLVLFGSLASFSAYTKSLFVASPIVGSWPAVTVLGSVFLLGISLSKSEGLAIALVILGIMMVSTNPRLRRGTVEGAGSAIATALLFGTVGLLSGVFVPLLGFVLFSVALRGWSAGFALLFSLGFKRSLSPPSLGWLKLVALAGLGDAIGSLAGNYGIFASVSNLPIISALSGLAGPVSVFLAILLFKERGSLIQWVGILSVLIGVFALSYL